MRGWWLYATLLAMALVLGLSAPSTVPDSPVPSAKNPGPRGLKLLKTWLEYTGREVRLLDSAALPSELKTLVIAAPVGHAISSAERQGIAAFVERGGTLVYLKPRRSNLQRELDEWLQLEPGSAPAQDLWRRDVLGVSLGVTRLPGIEHLRVLADETIASTLPAAVPLGSALYWAPLGLGEVFIGSGPDLAEGARLDLDDNAAFWASLRSPIGFDELHQAPRPKPDLRANLIGALLQVAFCALAFGLTFAPRLGPARPTPMTQHRSTLEYVRSMAALTRQAHVEPELASELVMRLKRITDLPEGLLPRAGEVLTPQEFLRLSQRCADLEAVARGLSRGT
jgi:hypothetical protein